MTKTKIKRYDQTLAIIASQNDHCCITHNYGCTNLCNCIK